MTDADLAALVVALSTAQQRRELARLDIAAVAIDQAPHVERLRVLALRALRCERVAGIHKEIAERADGDGALRPSACGVSIGRGRAPH
jgi:hypothetical protein